MICYRCGKERTEKAHQTYTDSNLIRYRTITVKNVTVKECECGKVAIYPNLADLLRLAKPRHSVDRFQWLEKEKRWDIAPRAKDRA